MIDDALTVAWKDLRELLLRRGRLRRGIAGALFPVAVFGLLLGVQPEIPVVAFLPVTALAGVVTDAFAGERERHTLETLLATPTSDGALLLGKVGASVAYGWGICLAAVVVGWLTSVLVGHFTYVPELIAFDVVFTLIVSLVEAATGVLVSLRAPTVRQAARTLGIVNLPILLVAGASRGATLAVGPPAAVVSLVLLVAVAATLLASAQARFRRGRLLLD